ncbi:MAG: hypothetical protein IPH82_19745 [Chloroflexi bacterium]|nr:hypothetical protein [Chloroflexota bacterium]
MATGEAVGLELDGVFIGDNDISLFPGDWVNSTPPAKTISSRRPAMMKLKPLFNLGSFIFMICLAQLNKPVIPDKAA